LDQWPDANALDVSDVDAQQRRFRSGHDVWIVQTFLLLRARLRALGHEVSLSANFPAGAVCIAHWDSLNRFLSGAHRCRIIGVRADRPPLYDADVIILQNNLAPDDSRHRFIPLWPQPGMLRRDERRGDRLETIAYFGRTGALPAWVRSPELRERLHALAVTLRISEGTWHDYREVDLVLSVRADSPLMLKYKPATKLYNSWLAGTPALLGDEPAYRAMRETDLDYRMVAGPDDVIAAVRQLKQNGEMFRAMVANGVLRGRAFARDATEARWMALIEEVAGMVGRPRSLVTHVGETIRQKLQAKRFRREHARGQAHALRESTSADLVPTPGDPLGD